MRTDACRKAWLTAILAFLLLSLNIGLALAQPPVSAVDQVANLIRVPLVRQGTDYTCGVAAFHSVIGYYGQDIRDDKLIRNLRAGPALGTHYRSILGYAAKLGYNARMYTGMTLAGLQACIDQGKPTIVILQAWADKPVDWPNDWEDGHYVVAVGYDEHNVYFMDPSTLGNYTYVPVAEFLQRWHDRDDRSGQKLIHAAIVIDGKPPAYNPHRIKRMR